MKSSELFDILGQIDDKFFEEAKQPDAQQGELIVAESSRFGSFMSIFAPIAACAAIIVAVVFGANFISKNSGMVGPNDSDSDLSHDATLSSDVSTVSEVESSVSTTESESSVPPVNNNEIRLEDYPRIDKVTVPNIKGSGLQTQMGNYDELLQKATLATLKCGDYELYMLGRSIHIDESDDPNKLYSYYVELAVVKDGKVISTDGPHTMSVSMGQGGYQLAADDLNNYLLYYPLDGSELFPGRLIMFRYHEPGNEEYDDGYECTFFTITDDGELRFLMGANGVPVSNVYLSKDYRINTGCNTIIDGDTAYVFNTENFLLNPMESPHFTEKRILLSEYPELDMSQVPNVAEITEWDQCLPKAKLVENRVGDYTFTVIGEYLRSPKYVNANTILAENVMLVISKNGEMISIEPKVMSGEFDIDFLNSEFMPTYEMAGGVVFRMPVYQSDILKYYFYGTIKDGEIVEFLVDTTGTEGKEYEHDYDPYAEPILRPEENALILNGVLRFTFDFNDLTATSSFDDESIFPINLADYKPYDSGSYDYQLNVILEEKEAGGYKFYLLGNNVKNVDNHYDLPDITISEFKFSNLIVAVEKDGKLVDSMAAFTTNVKYWETALIGQYLRPFEMKDGMGFVMYATLRSQGLNTGNTYAMIYKIENDTITQLKYEFDYAPAPATGSPWAMNGDFNVVPEDNKIVYKNYNGEETAITIDFANNSFSQVQ